MAHYKRLINAIVLSRIICFIESAIRLSNDLNGVDEQNLAAIRQPLEASKMAAINVQKHYLMGHIESKVKGYTQL